MARLLSLPPSFFGRYSAGEFSGWPNSSLGAVKATRLFGVES